MAQAGKQRVRDFHHVVFGMGSEEIDRVPELLAHGCNGVGKSGVSLDVPGSLTNGELAVAGQTMCQ